MTLEILSPEEFKAKVTECYYKLNMTQHELAEELGVSQSTVERWLGDKVKPQPRFIYRCTNVLELLMLRR
jgi:transcriptional regulator with XRE-family HTH domain